jgi:hypothetical protein
MTTIYADVNAKRKSWQPVAPITLDYAEEGTVDILSRCLALRALEIPVKDLILEGLSRHESNVIGEEGKAALLRNTEDEERHDIALNNCVAVFKDYDSSYEAGAKDIVDAWAKHPDGSILKAAALENGIFFMILPLLRRFGGASLRTTSVDISADEIGHVQLHRYAAEQLGHKPSKSLDNLRKATVNWIVRDFSHPQINAEKLKKASDSLMYRGVAPELQFTQTSQVPAFFERSNDSLPYYN